MSDQKSGYREIRLARFEAVKTDGRFALDWSQP